MPELSQAILLVLVFSFGATVASFCGVVLYRLPKADPEGGMLRALSPSSSCEHCEHRLHAVDLIPVAGWLLGKGRCRHCASKVSFIYPLMEAVLGGLSVLVAIWFGSDAQAAVLSLCLLWGLAIIAAIDWAVHIIPDEITWPLLFAGLLFSPFEPDLWTRVAGASLGCGLVWVSLVFTGLLKREDTMAGGDVALSAVCGAWLGLYAAPALLLSTAIIFGMIAWPRRRRGLLWTPMAPAFALAFFAIAPFVDKLPFLYGL